MTENLEARNTQPDDDYFGVCPYCLKVEGSLNAHLTHWYYCTTHKVRWLLGANLFTVSETEEEQRALWDKLDFDSYRVIEEFHISQLSFRYWDQPIQ
jgi:hypothetical protein